jgi:alpha-beta hydrolase superfamily lysophospholipase
MKELSAAQELAVSIQIEESDETSYCLTPAIVGIRSKIAKLDPLKTSPVRKSRSWLALVVVGYALSPSMAGAQMPPPINSLSDAQRHSESVTDQHGVLTSADNTCLFYRYWPPSKTASADRAVVVLHGIGYHSGPYKVIADALNPEGIHVYALDARGHGLSCGPRGYVGTPAQAVDDVSSMMQFVRKQLPAAKIYLLGESMGGAFALNYAREDSRQVSGLILLAPALDVNNYQLFKLGNLTLLPDLLFAQKTPAISLVDKRLEEGSRDTQFIAARRTDPLAYKSVSFRYLWDVKRLVKDWKSEISPQLKVPTLIVQGGKDLIVSHEDCQALAQPRETTDRQYKVFPEARHTTLWDPETPKILEFVTQWILAH